MFSKIIAIFCFVFAVDHVKALIELPEVDDNNLLSTEAAIRNTTNTLFDLLKLKGIRNKPRLKEYSTVHNHLISFTLQDYKNLKEIAKLTRVDRNKINNEMANFMAAINQLLNEDNGEAKKDLPDDDKSVVEYVDQFLTRLKGLKEQFGVDNKHYQIKEDVYQVLKDDVASNNYTIDDANSSEFGDNDTLLDESEFWKPEPITRRIYRGDRTKIKHFPFMASIQIFNKFHCGGSIIKSDLVITASSCLQLAWNNRFFRENPAFLSVRVGSSYYNGGGENIPVLEVYFHPSYDPKTLKNNLCILRLVRTLHFRKRNRKIKKINFDRHESSLPMTTDGITILGWGARETGSIVGNPWENVLSFSVLDIYPLRECQEIYSKLYVTHKNFCAGFFSKGGGACNHDVGGPGIVGGLLAGVVSFGSPVCGTPDAPTVFTKLGYYTDWIENIMELEATNIRVKTTTTQKYNFYTIGQHYHPPKTTFKIQPLTGKQKAIPISELDALRMLTNEDLFKDFMSTMFNDKEALEIKDLLMDDELQLESGVVDQLVDPRSIVKPTKTISEETLPDTTPSGPLIVTEIGDANPEAIKGSENEEEEEPSTSPAIVNDGLQNDVDENVSEDNDILRDIEGVTQVVEEVQGQATSDENKKDIIKIDENLKGLAEIDEQLGKLIGFDQITQAPVQNDQSDEKNYNSNLEAKTSKGKGFEKDLVNLIDDIDLKEIIDTIPSIEEDKLALDDKIVKLFNAKEAQEKTSNMDDSVLTLLYLSSSEKKAKKGKEKEYLEEDDGDDADRRGISIEAQAFKDMTYRSDNVSHINIIDRLTREEIEKILVKHLGLL